MAPALNAKSHSIKGVIQEAQSTTKTPNTGSANPERAPKAKAFFALSILLNKKIFGVENELNTELPKIRSECGFDLRRWFY